MKRSPIFVCLLLSSCAMATNPLVEVFGTVTDEAGSNQLALRFVQAEVPVKGDGRAYDFYSLDWEIQDGAKWTKKVAISRADFQKGCERRRWVSKVQSFNPGIGRAVLQIGEEGVPDATGAMLVTYTWREWDVLNNQEVRMIRVCKDPFESFEKGKGSS